jgi:hemolysin activation/secretion protein
MKPKEKLLWKIISSLAFLLISSPVYPQIDVERATYEADHFTREDVTEDVLRRVPEKPPKIEAAPPVAPTKEEEKFLIKKVELDGCESFTPADFSPVISKYEGKELGLSDLDNLAKEIESEYLRRNVIAAVFVPEQEIKEGAVKIQVVEARMGELQVAGHKYFNKERLYEYWKMRKGRILRYDKISKSVQLMNKNPDRKIKAALHAGKTPGTTDVLLSAETNFPLHLTASFDNEGASSTGRSRTGLGLRDNNFLGFDDTFIGGYSLGRDFGGRYFYHLLPLGYNATTLVYGYSRSAAAPTKEYAASGISSKAKSTAVSLHQDLFDKDEYIGEVYAGFDARDKTTWTNTGTYSRDRLRIFNLGGNLVRRDFASTTQYSLDFSQGVDAFGASTRGNPLASRGAKSVFSRLNLGLQHRQRLPLSLQANLKIRGQIASTKLTPQEEFSLGGLDSVRGYPAGDYLADSAANINTELLIPAFFIPQDWRIPYAERPLKEQITTLGFLDYGWGQRRGALATEKKRINELSAGAGMRVSLFNQALLRLEWGFPLGANRPITEAGHSRFHFAMDFQEKFPEEIDRIRKIIEDENIRQWAWKLVDEELSRPESPLAKKLYRYLYLAQISQREGRLDQAKDLYVQISQLSKSLYQQTEEYVRHCIESEKGLQAKHKSALAYYREGKFQDAKKLWQEIVSGAETKPLNLEF